MLVMAQCNCCPLPSPLYLKWQKYALHKAFWYKQLLNVMNLIATMIIFAVVIYLQGFTATKNNEQRFKNKNKKRVTAFIDNAASTP